MTEEPSFRNHEDKMKTAEATWRHRTAVRASLLIVATAVTITIMGWESSLEAPPRWSYVAMIYSLGTLWLLLLWFLGTIRSGSRAAREDVTLDNMDWHLDQVRSANLPDSRAAIPGGCFLSWLLTRDLLEASQLVGLDETIADFRKGRENVAELYENFGAKLRTSILAPEIVPFAKQYFDVRRGDFVDDLEGILSPDPFAAEPTSEHLHILHEAIDGRLRQWRERNLDSTTGR